MTLAERWRKAVDDVDAPDVRETQRGQALFRRGAVRDVTVTRGAIVGTVTDGKQQISVEVQWLPAPEGAVTQVAGTMRTQSRHAAALASRTLPTELIDAFEQAGVPLVAERGDLKVRCACDGWCRHGVALLSACAALFERDPLQVLALRGIDPDALLLDLRAGNGHAAIAAPFDPTMPLDQARGDLDALTVHPAPPRDPAGLLAHLGPPPGVQTLDHLAAIVHEAAEAAWRLAAGDGSDAANVEALLAELRGQQVATAKSLAVALGSAADDVAAQLDALYNAGEVMRTGTGADAKYRAARR